MVCALEADLIKKFTPDATVVAVGLADERQARDELMNEMNWAVAA